MNKKINYGKIDELLSELKIAYEKIVEDPVEYEKNEPATEKEVQELEQKLGQQLPTSIKDFFLNFSKEVSFDAYFPDNYELPEELSEIFSAGFAVSLDEVFMAEDSRQGWVEACFDDLDDEYDRVWHDKLGFMTVPNGDVIAFDLLDDEEDKRVVYLSHDDGEGHGWVLGDSFADYFENLVLIGACGNEDWQMIPFIEDSTSGINPFCENDKLYRKIIGFEVD